MTKLEQWEWIEAYHQGVLSPDEQRRVEQEIAKNDEFRQEAVALGRSHGALHLLALNDLVRRTVRHELTHGRQLRRRVRVGRWLAAVCASILLSAGYLTFSRVDLANYRNDITLTERYRPASDASPGDDELTAAQRTFYRQFFDAQTYLASGQPRPAIEKLEALAGASGLRPYFQEAIQWHLLNAYLLDKQPDNAQATYERLRRHTSLAYLISPVDRWKVWWQVQWQKRTL